MRKFFRKTNISIPQIETLSYTCQEVRNVSFSENVIYLLSACFPIWNVALAGFHRLSLEEQLFYRTPTKDYFSTCVIIFGGLIQLFYFDNKLYISCIPNKKSLSNVTILSFYSYYLLAHNFTDFYLVFPCRNLKPGYFLFLGKKQLTDTLRL